MIVRQIKLKPETPDKVYREFVEKTEKQGVFVACGSPDDKWINVKFDDEADCLAWMVTMGLATARIVE